MPADTKKEISFLPKHQDNHSFIAKLVRWVTTVGRSVIIFTELIVIAAFVSRFWLDRKNSDLSESIRQQKAILESTAPFEKDFLILQNRLKAIKKLNDDNINYAGYLTDLSESTPPDILYKHLSLSTTDDITSASISISTIKTKSITDFIGNLNLNQNIKNVEIKKISKKPKSTDYLVDLLIQFEDKTNEKNNST